MREPGNRLGQVLALGARLAAGSFLVYAGFWKAVSPPEEFMAVLEAYRIFPAIALRPLSLGLPWLEMITGLALLTGYFVRISAGMAAGLYGVFVASLLSVLLRGIELISCGCFGPGTRWPPAVTLAVDAVMALACVYLLRSAPSRLSLDAWIERGS